MTEALSTDVGELRRRLLERRLGGGGQGAAIPRADRTGPARLSPGQARVWFLDALSPHGTDWVVPLVLRAPGRLDLASLQSAVDGLAERHESLRTAYLVQGGEPAQQVLPAAPVELVVSTGPYEPVVAAALSRPFVLTEGRLLRAALVRGPEVDVVVLTCHHIACDGWSTDLLVRDLARGYTAAVSGRPAPDPPALQHLDWAVWSGTRPVPPGERQHWRDQLAGIAPLELPLDRPRPLERDPAAARYVVTADGDLAAAVRARALLVGSTPFAVLLAAYGLALSRRSGQQDVFIGTPVAGRPRAQLHEVVGYFANTVVLALHPGRVTTVGELLADARDTVLTAMTHDTVPFELLVKELAADRDLGRNPLVDVLLVLEGRPATATGSGTDLTFEELPVPPSTIKCDLILGARDTGTGPIPIAVDYATALWDPLSAARLAEDVLRCLEELTGPLDGRLDRTALTAPGEQEWLASLAGAQTTVPDRALHLLIRDQADRTPDAVAAADVSGTLTYAELVARVDVLAGALPGGPPGVVAVCLERGNDLLVALLAVLAAGHAYTPLDPDHPRERIAGLLADVAPVAVLTAPAHRDRLPDDVDPLLVAGAGATPRRSWTEAAGADLAYLLHTSGSTGRPKGVMVPHAGIVNRLCWMQRSYRLAPQDRVLQKTPLTFDVSVWELFWPLLVGARVVFAPPGLHLEPAGLAAFAEEHGVTHLHFVPSMLDLHCELTERFPATVRAVFCSGEALRAATVGRLADRSDAQLHNLYGPTEASVDVTALPVPPGVGDPVPIGYAVDNTEVLVLDRALRRCPSGVTGELYLAGVQLARGYSGRPDLTADRFVPHPFADGRRMYRTGDRGCVGPDGAIRYLGRADDQVKLRGVRIEPGEVEAVLRRRPAVSAACVVVRADRRGEPVLVGYVCGEAALDLAELRTALAAELPAAYVPAVLLRLSALPLTSSGKTDRRALASRELPGAVPAAATAPLTPGEELVLSVFTEVLGRPVGVEDSFFGAGGDSMRAIRVVAALRLRHYDVSVAELFRRPTARALAAALVTGPVAEPVAVPPFAQLAPADADRVPAGVVDAYPLSVIQAGMIFEMLGDPELAPYRNVTSYPVTSDQPFDADAFARALAAVVGRHEVLRTSVDLTGFAEPVQLVHADPVLDLAVRSVADEPDPYAVIRAEAAGERRVPFALDAAPLWRLRVHVVSETEWWLTEVECHVILDGWSHNLFLAELLDRYRAEQAGTAAERPAPRLRFADFVAGERAGLGSAEAEAFWRTSWADVQAPTLRPGWGSDATGHVTLQRDLTDLADGVDAVARRLALPRKTVLLSAVAIALEALTGTERPVIGLVAQARPESSGGDEVLGMFLNTLPFRRPRGPVLTPPRDAGRPAWRSLLADVHAAETALLAHRGFPLGEMYRRGMVADGTEISVSFNYLDFYHLAGRGITLTETVDESPNEFGLVVTALPGAIQASVHTRLLAPERADQLLTTVEEVLRAIVSDPEAPAEWPAVAPWSVDQLPATSAGSPDPPADGRPIGLTGAGVAELRRTGSLIAEAFAAVLPVRLDELDADSDFVALGGHSLDAMRIAAQLRNQGVTLSPRDLLRVRTLGALAGLAAGAGGTGAGGPGVTTDPVVELRAGTGRPWVLIHPGGGSVHWYHELAAALPEDRPVVGLQHPATTDPAAAGLGIATLAARYAAALDAHGIGPDVDLFGWCGGGPFSWELARLWQRAGGSGAVLLLDPSLEGLAGDAANDDQLLMLERCSAMLARRDAADWPRIQTLLRLVVDDERGHAAIPEVPDWRWLEPVNVWRDLARPRLAYDYPRLAGVAVTLLLGDELVEGGHVARGGVSLEGYLGLFAGRLSGAPDVHRVPGTHIGVLRPPNVDVLADVMARSAAARLSAGSPPAPR